VNLRVLRGYRFSKTINHEGHEGSRRKPGPAGITYDLSIFLEALPQIEQQIEFDANESQVRQRFPSWYFVSFVVNAFRKPSTTKDTKVHEGNPP
jgi:hypothetical protein